MNTTTAFNGLSTIELVMAGIAGVKLATLKQGPTGVEPRASDTPALGFADDTVKRLYFYSRQLIDEVKGFAGEVEDLEQQIFGAEPPRYPNQFIIDLCDGSKLPQAKRLAALHAELAEKELLLKVTNNLFWTEAKRRNPKMNAWSMVTLHTDWSFSGSDKDKKTFDLSDIFDETGLGDLLRRAAESGIVGQRPRRDRDEHRAAA